MTYDELVALALELPEVEEQNDSKGTCVLRGKGWMFFPKPDGDTVVLKLGWEEHDRLLGEHPDVLFKTKHYEGYPAVLVRLHRLPPALARQLVEHSWQDAPFKGKKVGR